MEDKNFKFKMKLGSFEFEVEGDKNFVEKTVNRYEGRFLPRFQQLLDNTKSADLNVTAATPEKGQEKVAPVKKPPESTPPARSKDTRRTPDTRTPDTRAPDTRAPDTRAQDTRPTDTRKPEKTYDDRKDNKDRSRYSRGGRKQRPPRNNSSTRVKPAPTLPKDQEISFSPYLPEVDEPVKAEPKKPEKVEKKSKSIDKGHLNDIFEKLAPRTHHEKILVFAYSLQDRNNYTDFTPNNIKECYGAVNADPAGNINQVLNHATRTGFLNKTQKGRQVIYSITSKGKHFVERGLKPGE